MVLRVLLGSSSRACLTLRAPTGSPRSSALVRGQLQAALPKRAMAVRRLAGANRTDVAVEIKVRWRVAVARRSESSS